MSSEFRANAPRAVSGRQVELERDMGWDKRRNGGRELLPESFEWEDFAGRRPPMWVP